MKKLFFYWRIAFFALLTGASACNYFPEEDAGALSSITIYDPAVDFSKYRNFAINDSIGYLQLRLNEITGKISPVVVNRKDPQTEIIRASALDKLRQYCNYTGPMTDRTQRLPPDLVIDLLYMDVPDNNQHYAGWWAAHHYWHPYEWFWNYPYFPYYPSGAMIPAKGTLIIDIKDLTNVAMMIGLDKNERIPVPSVWVGMVSGLDKRQNVTEWNDAIEACFTQTDAFKKNKK
ncbi:MAG: hypothetical protein LBU42_10190 [Prevotellaceae bacterium]|jgi:hypothetical protein|nr:hypothetical protein [Prevotellaceae bacterium]